MKRITTITLYLAPLSLALWALTGSVAADEAPIAAPEVVVQSFHDGLFAAMRDEADTYESRYAAMEPIVQDSHDLAYIARLAAGRHWRGMDESDQERYVAAFSQLSVASYAGRFVSDDGLSMTITGQSEGLRGGQVVDALLTTAEREVTFQYHLLERDGHWRIVNILADGVSDLALKRAEFDGPLSNGVDMLLPILQAQITELATP